MTKNNSIIKNILEQYSGNFRPYECTFDEDDLERVLNTVLSQKNQEHKAELERIEEKHQKDLREAIQDLDIQWEYEYKKGIKNAYSENWRQALESIKEKIENHEIKEKYWDESDEYDQGIEDMKKSAISIIDRHINSLTTE